MQALLAPPLCDGQGALRGGAACCGTLKAWARVRVQQQRARLLSGSAAGVVTTPPLPPASAQDGILNDTELNAFQVYCFNAPLQSEELVGVKQVRFICTGSKLERAMCCYLYGAAAVPLPMLLLLGVLGCSLRMSLLQPGELVGGEQVRLEEVWSRSCWARPCRRLLPLPSIRPCQQW